jgi:hypothetical protein
MTNIAVIYPEGLREAKISLILNIRRKTEFKFIIRLLKFNLIL